MDEQGDLAADVRAHYNARHRGLDERPQSRILQLRNLNNWIKSVLLGLYLERGMAVFDLCCGKGGDLLKFAAARVGYIFGADIADGSIDEARRRFAGRPQAFRADFVAIDLDREGVFPSGRQFDLVSCQFALHYSFESEAKARQLMRNAAARLRSGGHFVGTLPNACRLIRRLRELPEGELAFGNAVYQVRFDKRIEPPPLFGYRYTFRLEDAIDDLPEYVTHMPTLRSIAEEHGLELELDIPFHEFFEQHRAVNADLLDRMKVFNAEGTVPADEWEAAGLYNVFAFRKR